MFRELPPDHPCATTPCGPHATGFVFAGVAVQLRLDPLLVWRLPRAYLRCVDGAAGARSFVRARCSLELDVQLRSSAAPSGVARRPPPPSRRAGRRAQ
jgi:hypothetical protein